MDTTSYTYVSQEKSSWQDGECPELWKMNWSGLSFALNEGHPECFADQDQCQGEIIFLSATLLCESIWLPHQTKGLDRNIGSCLWLRPWRIWPYRPGVCVRVRVCVIECHPACPSLPFLLVLSGNTVLLWQVEPLEGLSILRRSPGKRTSDKNKPS